MHNEENTLKNRQCISCKRWIVLCIILAVVVSGCSSIANRKLYSASKLDNINKYLNVGYFYGLEDTNEEDIANSIYTSFVSELGNAATYYLQESAFQERQVAEGGNYWGLGLSFTWEGDGDAILIVEVIPNSPADIAGIQPGEHVVAIEGVKAIGANEEIGRAHV